LAALGNTRHRRAPNSASVTHDSSATVSITTDTDHAELSHYRSASARSAPRSRRRGVVANIVFMTLATGLVATMAIPAYAFAPTDEGHASTASNELTESGAQSVEVAAAADTVSVARDGFTATTPEELAAAAAAVAAAEAAAAEGRRQEAAAAMTSYAASYSGPSSADYLAAPAYPNFDLASVYGVASGYQGVPYVYGGATPAGFDCSGFIMYVYAQFGISLPHSSTGQGAAGTRIPQSEAQPGDLVIMDGHDGFYAGNGNILHAPYEGASVRVQPIWTSSYYIVRLGI
jgi:cell wall-associated NlpC family hydrolase